MTGAVDQLRGALEERYGLALSALSAEQIAAAAREAEADLRGAPFDPAALALVVDCLPIQESWLFRDDGLWSWLRDELAPQLLAASWERQTRLRVASVGCSNGPEPFSLAMVLQDLLEAWGVPATGAAERVEVVGLDCSQRRVAEARRGELGPWAVERCGPRWSRRRLHLLPGGQYRVDDTVRALCRFEVANLLDLAAGPGLAGFDLVLCRHTLIYFQPEGAAKAVQGLAAWLDPGTVLVLGAPEAHLLQGLPGLVPLGHLGAARLARREPLAPASRRRTSRPPAPAPAPVPAPPPPSPAVPPTAEQHLSAALAFAARGEDARALEEARAACFLSPDDFAARLVLARVLSTVDAPRGRAALRELLGRAGTLADGAGSACAPELSPEQLAAAARALLHAEEDR
ncbi:MAG: CheR family methyltransferase [Myxococcales bacterium]